MWIPSVLRLYEGAVIVTCSKRMFLQPSTLMWKSLLFREVIPYILEFVTKSNLKLWTKRKLFD